MKKLVAISVLFAGLATAVFAQSGGWSNEWKVGLTARFITDVFYTQHASGKEEQTQDTTPVTAGPDAAFSTAWGIPIGGFYNDGTQTWSKEYGKYNKGVTHYFSNQRKLEEGNDYRFILSLRNTGENYDMNFNISMDDWGGGMTFWKFISEGKMLEDWGIKGSAGIFSAGIGPWATEAAWVDTNADWASSSWLGLGTANRFGVYRYADPSTDGASGGQVHSNHFRTQSNWANPFAVGMALGDSFKFTLGYTVANWNPDIGGGKDSKSSINGTFMFSGSPADAIAFDLFYSIKGKDADTLARPGATPGTPAFGYNNPATSWSNIIGAYVQVKGIENLSLAVGYTVSFYAYEAGGFLCNDGDFTQSKAVTYNAPIYSGIDLRIGFTGIDKVGIKFNNNLSFAGVNGDKVAKDTTTGSLHEYAYKDKINLLLDENGDGGNVFKVDRNAGDGLTQNWFHWTSTLNTSLGFIDGVGLHVGISNRLGVATDKLDRTDIKDPSASPVLSKREERTTTNTSNELRVAGGVTYGVGNVQLRLGLFLKLTSILKDEEKTVTYTSSAGGTPIVVKTTYKKNNDTVTFGIPVTFQVSF